MDQTLVVNDDVRHGRNLIDGMNRSGFDVTGAAWLKEQDGGDWFLYLVTVAVDAHHPLVAYGMFNSAFRTLEPLPIDPFRVRLIGLDHPMARAIAKFQKEFRGPFDMWYRRDDFGGVPVEEVFIFGTGPTQ